jgi:hypothetical protein
MVICRCYVLFPPDSDMDPCKRYPFGSLDIASLPVPHFGLIRV